MNARLLEGHRVLVTGGARGLGLEFARAAASHGASVVVADILFDEAQQRSTWPTRCRSNAAPPPR
jgi:NAD(P)-dependent dehydrogenase (short-subunit alcohol dehydrogenase family)